MNIKRQVLKKLLLIAVLLLVCAVLVLLILSSNSRPITITAATTSPTVTESMVTESTVLPTQTVAASVPAASAPTQEWILPPEVLQRVDSQPITDAQTVRRIESYAEEIGGASQILLVLAQGTNARVTLHEKGSDNQWHTTCVANGCVGKNGVGDVFEGSGKTPQGVHGLSIAFGIQENPGAILPYTQVDDSYYWVDDPNSAYYNRFVSIRDVVKDWSSAEHLIRYEPSYNYAIAIDYNLECIPGAGSAFFVHCSSGEPTLGCVSVPEADMLFLLKTIGENAYIIIAQQ